MKLIVETAGALKGQVRVPGDKSISHRAVMFTSLADGVSRVEGFLFGADCLSTVACMRALGVPVDIEDGTVIVHGVGMHGLQEPDDVLDVGNSGTTIRLLLGLLSGQTFHSCLTGDASIRRRPMGRVARPLLSMGARIDGRRDGDLAPLSVRGADLHSIKYQMPVASAQVKSAILLAGLFASGVTGVREPSPSRDHTERMLKALGAPISRRSGYTEIGRPARLKAMDMRVPGDLSSAAFLLVATLIVPGSELILEDVGVNPTRTGILDVLGAMGAQFDIEEGEPQAGEPTARLAARSGSLVGTTVGGSLIPRLIDEIPILAVAAAAAEGTTEIRDARELRVKETDRIRTVAEELRKFGVQVAELEDGLIIEGGRALKGAHCRSHGDHRIAMAMAVAGLVAEGETVVEGWEAADVSFPGFVDLLRELGARVRVEE
ncbi:3-phosphoshikimate 1-carboxyvinyltransferase [Kyrpidia spormannii]|uniref:3-phosphoshikimate 1-carboxyvinyltransferase n=1 Tax=Kyrpidia spormannii TaxID=2055160 RepID=A0A2K8N692_9BACL|nr:3-phosphoshikimate 1-carboxyvinyltransferase [Kyrpidia spormannii]ATY84848.1 3-phosphoshikimate 1-carboxyvinyltransferase [Kyrpidia spormannii]